MTEKKISIGKEDLAMKNYNKPIEELDKDIQFAIKKYLDQNYINYGLIITILELHKSRLIKYSLDRATATQFKKSKSKQPSDYIG